MNYSRRGILLAGAASMAACSMPNTSNEKDNIEGSENSASKPILPVGGYIEETASGIEDLIDVSSPVEVIGEGYNWVEGPAWHQARNALYFSDVNDNVIYEWTTKAGVKPFETPGGVAQENAPGKIRLGSNGLWVLPNGDMMICNHGTRAVERFDFQTRKRTTIASTFQGKRLNSPNDVVVASDGTVYFTDPVSGLEGANQSPLKEQPHNGVYRVDVNGEISLLLEDMIFPNGVSLSPDERYLYIAQSEKSEAFVRRVELLADGGLGEDKIWFDARPFYVDGAIGNPDGMAVSKSGHLAVTGPGGIFLLTPDGKLLGRIRTKWFASNCCFGEDGQTLFITADDYMLRVKTKMTGVQWV
ncbi:SMP-30/gluconolactonase/LRE family protein [Hirschia litorea]|uniref:SMP-30/gluconolactonase/LRE family protein n=1 Tax=Hirschia litorea TaxID=1199156 RepID=A0ABW2INF3_9PROT